METKLRVSKDNALIDASYRLSLTEMQIILYGIGLINPTQPNFPMNYRIDIDRFAHQFNRAHQDIYMEVKHAVTKRLWERDFSYVNEKGKTVTLRWLTKMVHEDKSGYIEIKFSEEIQPYLHNLQSRFTAYYLDQVVNFRSVYSVRLYEQSLMFIHKTTKSSKFTLLVSDLKKQLELTNKYDRFFNFKTYVLEVAKKEINKFSDLNFDYKVIKLGRVPHQIEFTVSKKQKSDVPEIQIQKLPSNKLSTAILEDAKKLILKAQTGWDLYALEEQFYEYITKVGQPKNMKAAFIGFVKKKVAKCP